MIGVTPQMRNLAKRLIAHEANECRASAPETLEAFPVFAKLRPNLATLMGSAGLRALLQRALALSCVAFPSLRTVNVKADGILEETQKLAPGARLHTEEVLEGRGVLLAQLLELLVTFIGESLTLQLVSELWPQVSVYNLDFNEGDENEKDV